VIRPQQKMADIYSDQRLDKACHYTFGRSIHPNFKLIKQLIKSPIMLFSSLFI